MRPTWNTLVCWPDGDAIQELVVADSQPAAKRAARKLAMARRPWLGTPSSVQAHPDWAEKPRHPLVRTE